MASRSNSSTSSSDLNLLSDDCSYPTTIKEWCPACRGKGYQEVPVLRQDLIGSEQNLNLLSGVSDRDSNDVASRSHGPACNLLLDSDDNSCYAPGAGTSKQQLNHHNDISAQHNDNEVMNSQVIQALREVLVNKHRSRTEFRFAISSLLNDIYVLKSDSNNTALVNSEVALRDYHNAPRIENTLIHADDPPAPENISDEVQSTESTGIPDCDPQPSVNNEEMVLNAEHQISAHSDNKEQCKMYANPTQQMVVIQDQMANMMTRMENIERTQKIEPTTPMTTNNVTEDIDSIKRRLQNIESAQKNVSAIPVGVINVKEDINRIKRRPLQVERQSLQEKKVPKAVSCANKNNTRSETNSVQSRHIFDDNMTASAFTTYNKKFTKLAIKTAFHTTSSPSTTTARFTSISHNTNMVPTNTTSPHQNNMVLPGTMITHQHNIAMPSATVATTSSNQNNMVSPGTILTHHNAATPRVIMTAPGATSSVITKSTAPVATISDKSTVPYDYYLIPDPQSNPYMYKFEYPVNW